MLTHPVVVDLPESTWPMTTKLMCAFSFPIAALDTKAKAQK
jgi:hypothetical protein